MFRAEWVSRLVPGLANAASNSQVAFAKASRRIKLIDDPPFEIMHLTADLSQIKVHYGVAAVTSTKQWKRQRYWADMHIVLVVAIMAHPSIFSSIAHRSAFLSGAWNAKV